MGSGAPAAEWAHGHQTLLVTPAQRDRGVEILKEMYADGRLTHLEFDQRLDQALAPRTRAELNSRVRRPGLPPGPDVRTRGVHPAGPVQPYPSSGRGMGTLAHWLGYPTFFVGPALVAATAGQRNPAVRRYAVEAVNFQLTAFGMFALVGLLAGTTASPAFLFPLLGVAWFLLTGIGGLATALGSNFRYPFTVRLMSDGRYSGLRSAGGGSYHRRGTQVRVAWWA